MPRRYAVTTAGVTVSAAQDLLELVAAAEKPIKIVELSISQDTDVGDVNEGMVQLSIVRGYTTSGSGGSTPTPRPLDENDAAAGFSVEANNTTVADNGTPHVLHQAAFNLRTGYVYIPTPGSEPRGSAASAGRLVVRIDEAPGGDGSIDVHTSAIIEEL